MIQIIFTFYRNFKCMAKGENNCQNLSFKFDEKFHMQTKTSTANNFPPKSMQQISLETRRRSNCECKPDIIFSEFSYDLSAVTAPSPPCHALPPQIRVRNPLSIASPIIQLVSITFHSILLRFRFGHSSMKSIYEMNFASHKILYITNQPSKDCRAG